MIFFELIVILATFLNYINKTFIKKLHINIIIYLIDILIDTQKTRESHVSIIC